MSFHDRVLVVAYCIVVALFSFLAFLLALGWEAPGAFMGNLLGLRSALVGGILSLVMLLASFRLFYLFAIRRPTGGTLVYPGELGEVRISLTAMENLVRKVAGSVSGVKEVKSSAVLAQDKQIIVRVQVGVGADVNIPELSSQLQKTIGDHLLAVVGVTVEDVHILVANIADSTKRGRVE